MYYKHGNKKVLPSASLHITHAIFKFLFFFYSKKYVIMLSQQSCKNQSEKKRERNRRKFFLKCVIHKPSMVVVAVSSGLKSLFPKSFSARTRNVYEVNGTKFGTMTELDDDEMDPDPERGAEFAEMNIVLPSIQLSVVWLQSGKERGRESDTEERN